MEPGGARLHPRRAVLRLPRSRPGAAREANASARTATTASGSTSAWGTGNGQRTLRRASSLPLPPRRWTRFRDTLAGVPAPVTIVTTSKAPKGRTARRSAPSAPCPRIRRSSWSRWTASPTCSTLLPQTGKFAVNLLAARPGRPGLTCAKKGEDKLDKVPWHEDGDYRASTAPRRGSRVTSRSFSGGDHVIVVGLVTPAKAAEGRAARLPSAPVPPACLRAAARRSF